MTEPKAKIQYRIQPGARRGEHDVASGFSPGHMRVTVARVDQRYCDAFARRARAAGYHVDGWPEETNA